MSNILGMFAKLERKIVNDTTEKVLAIVDRGEMIGDAGLHDLEEPQLQRLRDLRDEIKRMREQLTAKTVAAATRPREVHDPELRFYQRWRCVNGKLEWNGGFEWMPFDSRYPVCTPTLRRCQLWGDLFLHPTEPAT